MAYTRHGWRIPFSPTETDPPHKIGRCGGPSFCLVCQKDIESYNLGRLQGQKDNKMADPIYMNHPLLQPLDKATELVIDVVQENWPKTDDRIDFAVYVVWFCFILGGWKALLSTTIPDNKYYEVTYNKDTAEAYIDTYVKIQNRAVAVTPKE